MVSVVRIFFSKLFSSVESLYFSLIDTDFSF